MIKIKLRRFDKVVEIRLPTEREPVMVSLWRLGLDRDPGKYTLRELNAVISYNTPWEHQMIRLIDMGYTLEDTISLLHRMLAPPYPIAAGLRAGIVSGCYRSGKDYLTELEMLVERKCRVRAIMYFPLCGEIVNSGGMVTEASQKMLLTHGQMINQAMIDLRRKTLHSETYLFSDVEGFYQKLLAAHWSAEQIEDQLVGKVEFLLSDMPTNAEGADAADKIEMIHSVDFAIRIKQWSVLTDRGLLFIYLCDHEGNYEIISPEEQDDDEEALDDEGAEQLCLCPECRLLRAVQAGMILDEDELEDADD